MVLNAPRSGGRAIRGFPHHRCGATLMLTGRPRSMLWAMARLTAIDATFLELEELDDAAHMHIGAVLEFDPAADRRPPTLAELRAMLRVRSAPLAPPPWGAGGEPRGPRPPAGALPPAAPRAAPGGARRAGGGRRRELRHPPPRPARHAAGAGGRRRADRMGGGLLVAPPRSH